jgi:hypothetical protein
MKEERSQTGKMPNTYFFQSATSSPKKTNVEMFQYKLIRKWSEISVEMILFSSDQQEETGSVIQIPEIPCGGPNLSSGLHQCLCLL